MQEIADESLENWFYYWLKKNPMRVCNNDVSKQGHFWTLIMSQRTHQSISVSVNLEGNQVSSWCVTALPAKPNYKSVPRFSGSVEGGLDSIWCWVEQLLGFFWIEIETDELSFRSRSWQEGWIRQPPPTAPTDRMLHLSSVTFLLIWSKRHTLGLERRSRGQKHTHHCDSLAALLLAINHH